MILRTVKVLIGDEKPIIKRFFDEKEFNVYLEKVYLNKMNGAAIGAGLKKYTPKTGTTTNNIHNGTRNTTNKYYDMINSCKENCYLLKVEITSENLNYLLGDARR